MAGEKTEKATPKKRAEARKKGQVARSADLTAPWCCSPASSRSAPPGRPRPTGWADAMRQSLNQGADPGIGLA